MNLFNHTIEFKAAMFLFINVKYFSYPRLMWWDLQLFVVWLSEECKQCLCGPILGSFEPYQAFPIIQKPVAQLVQDHWMYATWIPLSLHMDTQLWIQIFSWSNHLSRKCDVTNNTGATGKLEKHCDMVTTLTGWWNHKNLHKQLSWAVTQKAADWGQIWVRLRLWRAL